jgi:hypothetical protein
MRTSYWILSLVLLVFMMTFSVQSSLQVRSDEPAELTTVERLVTGATARSALVFSGRMEFLLTTGFESKNKVDRNEEQKLSFSGASWAIRYPPHPRTKETGARVSHNGSLTEYISSPSQGNVAAFNRASVGLAEPIDKFFPSPPVYAGTFWYPATRDYIKKNVRAGRKIKDGEVNGIKVEVLEWTIPPEKNYEAFHGINKTLERGGILRLYVAPQLGHVLPRIEHLSPEGDVGTAFDASDFEKTSSGVYLPHQCSLQNYSGGQPAFFCRFRIHRFEKINEQIPESDFILDLPEKARVSDHRTPNGRIFTVGEADAPQLAAVNIAVAQDPSWWGTYWHYAVILGALVGGLALFLYLRFRRKRPTVGGGVKT